MALFGIRSKLKSIVKQALHLEPEDSDSFEREPSRDSNAQAGSSPSEFVQKTEPDTQPEQTEQTEAEQTQPEQKKQPASATPVSESSISETSTSSSSEHSSGSEASSSDDSSSSKGPVTATAASFEGQELSMDAVQEILDEDVRPALQMDGGDISLVKIEENNIYVKLVGACSTCPSSVMTMRMGVENLLREEFPSMNELIEVKDEALEEA